MTRRAEHALLRWIGVDGRRGSMDQRLGYERMEYYPRREEGNTGKTERNMYGSGSIEDGPRIIGEMEDGSRREGIRGEE